ncbi:MAG: trypsin-like peptidase domain-containing protein [Patescibacteria group bacterium]
MLKKRDNNSVLVLALIISFVVGGVSGGVIGSLTSGVFTANNQTTTSTNKQVTVQENSATIDVVKAVSPSVVSIVISKDLSEIYSLNDPFGFYYGYDIPQGQTEIGGGTGFIISSDGLILTNRHVISDTEADYTVITNSGDSYEATVIGTDPFNDIGVVKIEAPGLVPVQLGDSNDIQIGQTVIAIGNALAEYSNTVTRGVISGINRTITAGDASGQSEVIEEAIQTDAAINPGNSGGPLLNIEGQVIGINTAINQAGEAVGFAIPINVAKPVVTSVELYGRIIRPMLGIRYRVITSELAEANELSVDYGALLITGDSPAQVAVLPDSPADLAGLKEGDIILEFNEQRIDSDNTIGDEIAKYQVDEQITLKVLRDGQEFEVKVTLAEYDF